MARIFKNKTGEAININSGNVTVIVPANSQVDLSETFAAYQLASSDSLVEELARGTEVCQLNDGESDLSFLQAIDLVRGYFPKVAIDSEGRQTVRSTVARNGYYHLKCFTFRSSDPSFLINQNSKSEDSGDVTVKCYDALGVEVTTAPYSSAVKTFVDFEPTYNYEIIGGTLYAPSSLFEGTTNEWFAACVGLPDIPSQYGGDVDFVNKINLEAFDGLVRINARATSYLPHDANTHTGKVRTIIFHPAGAITRFQMALEIYA
jgi:hypothetical protein